MRIYLDEDLSSDLLIRLLQKAGHDVERPASVGMLGRSDPVQLTIAIRYDRVSLTANYDDYDELHQLISEAQGRHPGLLVVRREHDSTRNLTPRGIVNAIRKLEAAGIPIANEYIVLNHWR